MSDTAQPARMTRSKITHHCWAPPKPFEAGATKKEIGAVFGKVSGTKDIKMPNGDVYVGLKGTFEAENSETGEITDGGILYLPSGFQELVIEQVRQLGEGESLELAYRVFSVPSNNPQGFSYAFEPVLQPTVESDALANLRKLVHQKKNAPKAISGGKRGDQAA